MLQREAVNELRTLIHDSQSIVVLSGAGMSTESGIPDFRSPGGVWEDEDLMNSMSERYLRLHPEEFWHKFKFGFMSPEYLKAKPNLGHYALVRMAKQDKDVSIFTQNVDGLHQLAGSRDVFELHGNIRDASCPRCQQEYDLAYLLQHDVPRCDWVNPKGQVCDTVLRPDTVLFGQMVRHYEDAVRAFSDADLVLVLGTSLMVEPVSDLPSYVAKERTRLAIVNLEATHYDALADLVIHARLGAILDEATQ